MWSNGPTLCNANSLGFPVHSCIHSFRLQLRNPLPLLTSYPPCPRSVLSQTVLCGWLNHVCRRESITGPFKKRGNPFSKNRKLLTRSALVIKMSFTKEEMVSIRFMSVPSHSSGSVSVGYWVGNRIWTIQGDYYVGGRWLCPWKRLLGFYIYYKPILCQPWTMTWGDDYYDDYDGNAIEAPNNVLLCSGSK